MSVRPNDAALKQIGRLFREGTVAGLGDGELIARFVARRDEAAFEALVCRHGPMVLGICRRMLSDPHDADDAFQATFLVFVRKARGLRDADRLAPWLYGVAHRVAGRARIRAARRAKNEATGTDVEPSARSENTELIDLRSIIDAELARLSSKHREVLVLCLLEGLSTDEAAARLRCPAGTIKSRLARGRETLKVRLTARGLAPSLVASAVLGSAVIVRASVVPERLLTPLLRAAVDSTGSLGPLGIGAAALTREAMIPMVSKSVKLTAILIGGLGLGALGINAIAQQEKTAVPTPETEKIFIDPQTGRPAADPAQFQTDRHMMEVLLAFHQYHDSKHKLPSSVIANPEGRPLLSWRVAILPYVGEMELYSQFRLNEPWDSAHNIALAARMPRVFQTPNHPTERGETRIRGFSGDGTAFGGVVTFAMVTDGISNTAVLGISTEAVPWTQPEGMIVTDDLSLVSLVAEADGKGPLLGMMDGSLRRLKPNLHKNPAVLRALTSIAGGDVLSADIFNSPPTNLPPTNRYAGGAPVDGRTPPIEIPNLPIRPEIPTRQIGPPSSIEQRLESIERKLDLLLQRSNAAKPTPDLTPSTPQIEPAPGTSQRR